MTFFYRILSFWPYCVCMTKLYAPSRYTMTTESFYICNWVISLHDSLLSLIPSLLRLLSLLRNIRLAPLKRSQSNISEFFNFLEILNQKKAGIFLIIHREFYRWNMFHLEDIGENVTVWGTAVYKITSYIKMVWWI